MIGYIVQGSSTSFGNIVDYANDPKKGAKMIGCSGGVFTLDNRTIADSFEMQAAMNPRLGSPMSHIILSFSARDTRSLTDEKMAEIAEDYLQRMGYEDTQSIIFRHFDKRHPHCHVIANRVNNKGRTIKDNNEHIRNIKVCKELTVKYGLYLPKGKEGVHENRLRGMDAIRYHMMHAVRESLQISSTWAEFSDDLRKAGLTFRFRYNAKTHGIEGISFTLDHNAYGQGNRLMHDISFSGRKLDPSLTLSRICERLGNPVTIVHESAREIYEREKEDYRYRCTWDEFRHIDEKFPDFDSLFPAQAEAAGRPFPAIEGDYTELPEDYSAETDILSVGLEMLGVLIMQPYQAKIGPAGGGSSSDMKWNDEDKKKKRPHWEYSRTKTRSR